MVDEGGAEGEVYHAAVTVPEGCYYPPTLVTGLAPSARLMQEEVFGPVLVSTTFRTPAEAVQLANDTRYGLAASVWSENVNLALDVAPKLAAGVIWVNGTNFFDAAAGFGGVRESGFGREGGWEGLQAYLREEWPDPAPIPRAVPAPETPQAAPGIDRTAKMYVGGRQVRPDGGYSRAIWARNGDLLGHVGEGNRKDIRNAVAAAEAAAAWSRTTGHNRAQILYYVAENLAARAPEFSRRIDAMTGQADGETEVEATICRLFTWAAWADKHDGAVKGVPLRGLALALNEPIGVIGALCPAEAPLLGAVTAMGPALAAGNRVVLVPSEPFPLAAIDLYQILDTSDVPAGTVNIVTGAHAALAPVLAAHAAVGAVWNFSDPGLSAPIEANAADTLKQTWALRTDWRAPQAEGRAFLRAATEVKTVWVPYGE
jgi:aldehyde dehydrogenase (NAD+)